MPKIRVKRYSSRLADGKRVLHYIVYDHNAVEHDMGSTTGGFNTDPTFDGTIGLVNAYILGDSAKRRHDWHDTAENVSELVIDLPEHCEKMIIEAAEELRLRQAS